MWMQTESMFQQTEMMSNSSSLHQRQHWASSSAGFPGSQTRVYSLGGATPTHPHMHKFLQSSCCRQHQSDSSKVFNQYQDRSEATVVSEKRFLKRMSQVRFICSQSHDPPNKRQSQTVMRLSDEVSVEGKVIRSKPSKWLGQNDEVGVKRSKWWGQSDDPPNEGPSSTDEVNVMMLVTNIMTLTSSVKIWMRLKWWGLSN